jgi:hypothetical protein
LPGDDDNAIIAQPGLGRQIHLRSSQVTSDTPSGPDLQSPYQE